MPTLEDIDRQLLLQIWSQLETETDPEVIRELKRKEKAILTMLQ